MEDEKSLINTLIKASIESAPQPDLHVELFDSDYISQCHTMISIPFGLGKSSKANQIPHSFTLYKYSLPAMVGSINENGDLIESALFNAKKKVLVVDEGHRMGNDARDALLNLLSNGYYSRSLGYKMRVTKTIGTVNSGFKIKPYKTATGFELWTKFSCVYFCEWLPKRLQNALLSRFNTVILNASVEDAYEFALGKSILGSKLKNFKFEEHKEKLLVPKEFHEEFVELHKIQTKPFWNEFKNDTTGYIPRNIINLIRLGAHFARMDGLSEMKWKHFQKVVPLIKPTIKASLLTKLSPKQFEVFNMVRNDMTQKEIASELGISEPYVSELISAIRTKGLI